MVLLFPHIHHYAIVLGAHHCAIVYGCIPHCDVASGHFSSCFSSWLHKVKLLLNFSK